MTKKVNALIGKKKKERHWLQDDYVTYLIKNFVPFEKYVWKDDLLILSACSLFLRNGSKASSDWLFHFS